MASTTKSDEAKPAPLRPPPQPRIPLTYITAPAQRLYVLSFGALLQAVKARCFLLRWWYPEYWWRYLFTWVALDALFILGMAELRIPRLTFSWKARLMQIFVFGLFNVTLFKPYDVSGHLFGQHTVRLSPISTAKMNPLAKSFCLEPPEHVALIPIVFNNTHPTHISYSLRSLGDDSSRTYVNLSSRDLKQIEKIRSDTLTALEQADPDESDDAEDDYYDYNDLSRQRALTGSNDPDLEYRLEKTEMLQYIKVSRPGVVRLERALDQANNEVRIRPTEVTVVYCPKVEFMPGGLTDDGKRCAGTSEVLDLKMYGVAPLALRWHRDVAGRRENFLVEGIEGHHRTRGRSTAEELRIPLTIHLDVLGRHTYSLDALTDGVGNTFEISSLPSSARLHASLSATVLRRSAMSFKSCGPGRPASLLIGKETPLLVMANDADVDDGPWDITIKYQPPSDDKRKFKPWQQNFKTPLGKRELTLLARAPGEYSITGVRGRYCPGDVLSPETCRVIEQTLPIAQIEWKRIHECSGDTGVSVSLILQGKPPFKVFYQTKRDGESTRELSKVFHGSRGEITLQPERSGSYTYTFLRLSDANYENVNLEGPSIDQVVHPLAAADFVKSTQADGKRVLHSCSGSLVDVDVELKGTPPWNLEIQILGRKATKNVFIPELKNHRETLRLPIPSVIDEEGGTFLVDLVSVEDAYGCKRQLSVPGISVNVKRVKPTVKFYAQNGKRQISVLQGSRALLPLRLTGDAPWLINYRRADDLQAGVTRVTLTTANEHLSVSEAGLYELLEVNDAYCPGSVITNEDKYLVEWIPRPTAHIANTTQITYIALNGTFILPGVCEGSDDHVDLDLNGSPPFQLIYNVAKGTDQGGIKLIDQPNFSSIQASTRFQLQTSNPGRFYYEVHAIGDSSYPIPKHAGAIPHSERLQFEQEVYPRPTAYFKRSNRISFCLNDQLTPRDDYPLDGTIVLKGIPPFTLDISIKNLASSETYQETIETRLYEWKLDIPSYSFRTVGPHLVTIDAIRDGSKCRQSELDTSRQSQWIDVAETAVIVPFDRREDYCVGEALQFQLEGTPPWKVKYRFDGKLTSAHVQTSPFRRVADRAGEFSVVSIAHEQDMCQTTVSDLSFRIHNIPSAKVSHGKKLIQNIREGDQAEIRFELIGEPPFTFTYQRAELASNVKRGNTPKVLETHTVSGVNSKDYSIYSAAEGTWTVSFIQDRYCRYPPIQAEKGIEQA
ncbi:hypothetical protein JB92DRAFT_3082946 [Gautieria morchelliformis]|nr:hypothetical protein JB92DRAFT_3082946 [Gautieria morchelliformis]